MIEAIKKELLDKGFTYNVKIIFILLKVEQN